jgi:beta-fructofuranosidase
MELEMNRRKFLVSSLLSSVAVSRLGSSSMALAATLEPAGRLERSSEDQPDALPGELREKLMHDPYRPQFHLLPKANWMNDPCAPRFYKGEYHVFFQYNPNAPVWGDMHWNHASSPDLIHWKHLPLALAPTPGGYDAFGCFTGSVLPGMETAAIIYTATTRSTPELATERGSDVREQQCIATSTGPDLVHWTKMEKAAIPLPPPGLKVTGFRDPCPWKDGDTWYLIIGSGFDGVGGAVLLYKSSDGLNWEYLHPLAQGKWNGKPEPADPVDTGEMWECPDFFPLGEKHVLLYSTERKVYWEVGTLDKQAMLFHTETQGLLDHGHYYAMKSMLDEKGRRILWGWVTEARDDNALRAAGWAGSMGLPRVLTVGADNRLRMEIPPEFASLKEKPKTVTAPKSAAALSGLAIRNRAGAVTCSFAGAGGLEFRAGGASLLSIEAADGSLKIGDVTLTLAPGADGISTVQIWWDGSVIEIFADDREVLTARSYTGTGDIEVAWTGAVEGLKSLSVAGVKPISKDRLTS